MSGGKHVSYEEYDVDTGFGVVKIIIAIVVILAIIGAVNLFGKDDETEEMPAVAANNEVSEAKTSYDYEILGKIIIDKIAVNQPILDSTEDAALEKGVIKLHGGNLNEEGNFCIAGHNEDAVFKRLDELAVGDEVKIADKQQQENTYKITAINTVQPTDLELLKTTPGKTQITLITCKNYATERLILTAEKK